MPRNLRLVLILAISSAWWALGCGDKPIGQPCTFDWPTKTGDGGTKVTDCSQYPQCHPLQKVSGSVVDLNNQACPKDCIQMPSLQCDNLICVATQVSGDSQAINGQCCNPQSQSQQGCTAISPQCSDPIACGGYCTKECLSDASCPKGYVCNPMAPYGSGLSCDDESKWGNECTGACDKHVDREECPDTDPAAGIPNYTVCDDPKYAKCCACICYQFCPLLKKKFCIKKEYDQSMFPFGKTTAACGGT